MTTSVIKEPNIDTEYETLGDMANDWYHVTGGNSRREKPENNKTPRDKAQNEPYRIHDRVHFGFDHKKLKRALQEPNFKPFLTFIEEMPVQTFHAVQKAVADGVTPDPDTIHNSVMSYWISMAEYENMEKRKNTLFELRVRENASEKELTEAKSVKRFFHGNALLNHDHFQTRRVTALIIPALLELEHKLQKYGFKHLRHHSKTPTIKWSLDDWNALPSYLFDDASDQIEAAQWQALREAQMILGLTSNNPHDALEDLGLCGMSVEV